LKTIPENQIRKRKEKRIGKGPAPGIWPSNRRGPASPPGPPLSLSRTRIRTHAVTDPGPHSLSAYFADKRAPSTSPSSSPNPAQEHVAARFFPASAAILILLIGDECVRNLRPCSGYKILSPLRSIPLTHQPQSAARLSTIELAPPRY
jgi:hypothetical protein